MDTISSPTKILPKVLNHRFRAARRYYFTNEDSAPMLISSTRQLQLQHRMSSSSPALDNPLVLAAIVAGVIGVTLIAVIIIGVWIRTKLTKSSSKQSQRNSIRNCCSGESTTSSSMSTINEAGNVTQLETIRLDDTADFETELQSVVVDQLDNSPARVEIVISVSSQSESRPVEVDTGLESSLTNPI